MYMYYNDIFVLMFAMFSQDVKFSNGFLECWEAKHKMRCTDHSVKLAVLKGLVKKIGLSVSGKSIVKLRIILESLRQHALPLFAKTVGHELAVTYDIAPGGDGLRSPQQRSFRLLALMDPTLEPKLGLKRKQIKIGDFEWCEAKKKPLWQMIHGELEKWIRIRPPYGYDETQSSDLWFWEQIRNAGLTWVKSQVAVDFTISWLYQIYAGLSRPMHTQTCTRVHTFMTLTHQKHT